MNEEQATEVMAKKQGGAEKKDETGLAEMTAMEEEGVLRGVAEADRIPATVLLHGSKSNEGSMKEIEKTVVKRANAAPTAI